MSTLASGLSSSISDLFNGSTNTVGDLTNIVTSGLQIASPYLNKSTQQAVGIATTQQPVTAAQLAQVLAAATPAPVAAAPQGVLGATGGNEVLLIAGIGFAAILVLLIISEKG